MARSGANSRSIHGRRRDETIPTGEVRPVSEGLDFRRGKSMQGLRVDAVLTGLEHNAEGFVVCSGGLWSVA